MSSPQQTKRLSVDLPPYVSCEKRPKCPEERASLDDIESSRAAEEAAMLQSGANKRAIYQWEERQTAADLTPQMQSSPVQPRGSGTDWDQGSRTCRTLQDGQASGRRSAGLLRAAYGGRHAI